MMTKLLIVIPTYDRCDLLDRTLKSMAECHLPPNLEKVIVVENGKKSGSDLIVKKYVDRLPLIYRFTEKANKSNALNQILQNTGKEFIIFFDDDVRVHPNILLNYSNEVGEHENDFFLCGRTFVDYEEKPPTWLLQYSPVCIKGWHFNDKKCKMDVPDGLGANWGAFSMDMKRVGGFDERRGPGSGSIGQDTNMMGKLLNKNIIGYYLPDCIVWHFVPKVRSSPEWVLNRAYKKNVGLGIDLAQEKFKVRTMRMLESKIKLFGIHILLSFFGNRFDYRSRFHYEYRKKVHSGILKGICYGRFDLQIE